MWELLRWLHLLAMAFFVGGQLVLATVVVPVVRRGDREALRATARRFGVGSLVAFAVFVATGVPMAGHYGDWDRGLLQVKLALVAIAAALIAWHARRAERHAIEGAVLLISLAIVWLGVALAHTAD